VTDALFKCGLDIWVAKIATKVDQVVDVFYVRAAFAEDVLDTGDTAWMIVATALVMMMTPAGLALFYGGMSRYKNLLNTFAMTFVSYCLASVVWVMWGYTLAFGPSIGRHHRRLRPFFLAGIGVDSLSGTIPTYVFALFQMTFAGITVALVLGSIVDRMKFSSWIVFTVSVAHLHLLPHRPLGMGRRLDGRNGRP
jgi:Amt family ammonium transporter